MSRLPIPRTLLFVAVCATLLAVATVLAGATDPAGSENDRLFVQITVLPEPGGGSAIVAFDVDSEGLPTQAESYELEGLASSIVAPQAIALDPVGRFLFAGNNLSGDVSVFSIEEGGTLAPVAGSPFPVGDSPILFAVHSELRILYATQFPDRTIGVYPIGDDGSLTEAQVVPSRGIPVQPAVGPDGRFLYVSDLLFGVRGFAISDLGTLTELPGSPFLYDRSRPFEIAISADLERLFVLDLDVGIAAFEIEEDGSLDLIPGSPFFVGGFSEQLVLAGDAPYLYAALFYPGQIKGHSAASDRLSELRGSPFRSDPDPADLLSPSGKSRLYEVTRGLMGIVPFSIGAGGELTALSESVSVEDPEGRVPTGAVYFRAVVDDGDPDEDEDEDEDEDSDD
jgi:6-phosphogluconolactonase (cycloisomerase 2 family)